jgi:hypothetical protein
VSPHAEHVHSFSGETTTISGLSGDALTARS